jgi:uncharacterized membrane protein (UPF0127 family)
MRIRSLIAGLFLVSGLAAGYLLLPEGGFPFVRKPRVEVGIGGRVFDAEAVRSSRAHKLGLGGRKDLCGECAMLFVFDTADRYAFWMKGMRFPLDIVWIRGDRVVHVARNVPVLPLESIVPPEPADRVLEVNAGMASGVRIGDVVEWR